jgi:exodeoxyribonuclease VII small subunit
LDVLVTQLKLGVNEMSANTKDFRPGFHSQFLRSTEWFWRFDCGLIANWTGWRACLSISDVPSSPKTAGSSQINKSALPFEEALQKLEGIVENPESDDLPLEALLAKYEEGTRLAKLCQDKLAEAELKISQLEKTAGGEFKLKPLSSELAED